MGLLRWALFFFLLAIVAFVVGWTDLAMGFAVIGRFLFWAFLVLLIIFLVLGLAVFRRSP